MKKFIQICEFVEIDDIGFEETDEPEEIIEFDIYVDSCGGKKSANHFAKWLEKNYYCETNVIDDVSGGTPTCPIQNELWEKYCSNRASRIRT